MSHFSKDAKTSTNAPDTEAWRSDITTAFALQIMAVATEVVSVHPDDPRSLIEQAGDAIDAAFAWSHPRRRERNPEAWAIGHALLRMVAREDIDPCNEPKS